MCAHKHRERDTHTHIRVAVICMFIRLLQMVHAKRLPVELVYQVMNQVPI